MTRQALDWQLGGSAVRVSRFGFGAAPIGNLFVPMSDAHAFAAVDAAWDAGIRYFDTAPHYGIGLSERRLGAALSSRDRSEFVVSTKVGRLLDPVGDGGQRGDDLADGFAVPATHVRRRAYDRDGVLRSIEDSLSRLDLDRIDLVLVHDPDSEEQQRQTLNEALPTLIELRDAGTIGAVGAGMNQCEALARLVRESDLDAILLAGRYTLMEQPALAELLPLCVDRGVSVVAAGVFNSGLLATDELAPDATYDYVHPRAEIVDRVRKMAAVCARHGVTLPQAALAFPQGHPAVASVLVGARSAEEVAANAARSAVAVPADLWSDLIAEGLLPKDVPVP